jgi:hypothetical protein
MRANKYTRRVKALGYTPYSIAPILGIGPRQSLRYATAGFKLPAMADRLLEMLERFGIPEEWK